MMTGTCRLHDTRPTIPNTEPTRSSTWYGLSRAVVTTEHPASSHDQPVLIVDGQPFGPADLPTHYELDAISADEDEDEPPFHAMTFFDAGDPAFEYAVRSKARREELEGALIAAGYRVRPRS